jgi:LuxR family maltose regulon positive regulatory protein
VSDSILKTKLHIAPPTTRLVARTRLLARLDETQRSECKLILISAPTGFGKTTLLSEWIHDVQTSERSNVPMFAWLSLDDGR